MEKYKNLSNQASKGRHLNLRAELEKWWISKQSTIKPNSISKTEVSEANPMDKAP